MAMDKFFIIESSGNVMSPRCRGAYLDLFTPTQVKGQGKSKFRATLFIPKSADVGLLKQQIDECATDALGAKKDKTKWRNPLLKTADEPAYADLAGEYPYFFRPNSDNKPQVIKPNKAVVDSSEAPDEVYTGRWCRASFGVYWYSADKSPIPGVGLGLSNVQLLEHDDPLPLGGGRAKAESEFDEVDEKDLADMEG